MTVFRVQERVEISLSRKGGINATKITEMSQKSSKQLDLFGCYIYAVNHKKKQGFLPIYVGKAAKQTLAKEALSPDKQSKVNMYLEEFRNSHVVLFLITHPIQKGPRNIAAIEQMEEWLIRRAFDANPNLINKKGVKPPGWGIAGYIRGSKRQSRGSRALTQLLKTPDDAPSPPGGEAQAPESPGAVPDATIGPHKSAP